MARRAVAAEEPVPDDVVITGAAREPIADPTLGIPVSLPPIEVAPSHRLVSIGDSLTHGFQSLAIHKTDMSYPALVARELGCAFDHPLYPQEGGPPLNLEYILRSLENRLGEPHWWNFLLQGIGLLRIVDRVMRCWQVGEGSQLPSHSGPYHDLAVYGWDLRDTLSRNADTERADLDKALAAMRQLGGPGLSWSNLLGVPRRIGSYVTLCSALAGLSVLESARTAAGVARTPLEAARDLGERGGIETLIVFIGANNALGSVLDLAVHWSRDGYDDLERKQAFNVWRPTHFAAEFDQLAAAVHAIDARHVIVGTVPHVTIAPLARGVGDVKHHPGSRYFPYYTRPWISDRAFNPSVDQHLTADQARAVDSAIDQYNDVIVGHVRSARQSGKDWLLMDVCGLLDRAATRRYALDPQARPAWWTPYPLPAPIAALTPPVDSRFFRAGPSGRTCGGLFALDGVHPTTVGYGIVAQEFINVMAGPAGVAFPSASPRIDFATLLQADSLLSTPPASIGEDLRGLGRLNRLMDLESQVAAALRRL